LEKEFENISEAVNQLHEKKYVKYFKSIGQDFYVSVTTGFWCVDLRRFYTTKEGALKPSRDGLALRLNEWNRLYDFRGQINDDVNMLLGLSPPVAGEPNDSLTNFLHDYGTCSSVFSQLLTGTNVL
jgi:hypothetical protein